jgi:hypothetical protein
MSEVGFVRNTSMLSEVNRVGDVCKLALAQGLAKPMEATLEHYFGTETYSRVANLPPRSVLEGKTHRWSTILVILKGSIDIIMSHGERLHMPQGTISVQPPMTRRAVATREGATVMTIHHTGGVDVTAPDALAQLHELLIAEE